jgi:hypothetical protein
MEIDFQDSWSFPAQPVEIASIILLLTIVHMFGVIPEKYGSMICIMI